MRTTKSNKFTRMFGGLAAAAVLGVALLSAGTQAAAVPVSTGANLEIRNQHSNLCLDDFNFDTQDGAEARQWTCTEGTNQRWEVRDLGTGYAEIKNLFSNLCLDTLGSGPVAGAEIRQKTCLGTPNQQWQINDVGNGYRAIVSRASTFCLDNKDFSQADGALIQQWPCNGNTTQRWSLTDPSTHRITYTLVRANNPTADQVDAYDRITVAMDRAVSRYNRLTNIEKHVTVFYDPAVRTADANINGSMRFGAGRIYMQEGTALHELSHTVGLGYANFEARCQSGNWPSALPLLRSWNGPNATINCANRHMSPYGLNGNDYTESNFERHTKLVQAMKSDGM